MAIVMRMNWQGASPEQYEAIRKLVNWEGDPPPGLMMHVAAFGEDGLQVTALWKSAEEFNAFMQDRLKPGVMKVGIPGEPKMDVLPVHALFAPGLAGD